MRTKGNRKEKQEANEEWNRFQDAVRDLMSVPKEEVEKMLEEERQRKKGRREKQRGSDENE